VEKEEKVEKEEEGRERRGSEYPLTNHWTRQAGLTAVSTKQQRQQQIQSAESRVRVRVSNINKYAAAE
jgi:hypothetical protein